MDIFLVIILGIVQGFTEFLPISSTGHLILFGNLLGTEGPDSLAFDAVLHLATATAVVVYFFSDIWVLIQTFLRLLGRQAVEQKNLILLKALAIATIPAVIFGLLLESYMETVFRTPMLVAIVLIIGSFLFIFAEHRYQSKTLSRPEKLTVWMGLQIGFFQVLALIPGMSRSGATISGGMILGLSRIESTRFAFLLAIPVLLGGGMKKLMELLTSDTTISFVQVGIGAVVAFIVGLFAIHFMISFVRRHTLWPFIWYRIVLAGIVLVTLLISGS